MDLLPTEIKKDILSHLSDKHALIARVACTDWFRCVEPQFQIEIVTPRLLSQVTERLSTYSRPIELVIKKARDLTASCFIHNISQLTQLKSFQLQSNYCFTNDIQSALDWIEHWSCNGVSFPIEILNTFPRLKYCDNIDPSEAGKILRTCTNLEYLLTKDQNWSDLPISLTRLEMEFSDRSVQIDSLSRLTKLKALRIIPEADYMIDCRPITGLETLTTTAS